MKQSEFIIKDGTNMLDTVTKFQLGAEKVERYLGNGYVEGDNIAEHTARMARLAIYSMPFLKEEFKDQKNLAEDIYVTILTHDDEEVVEGFDIRTTVKNHDSRAEEEIELVRSWVKNLPIDSQEYVLERFSAFRKRDTLVSKIVKVFDNITGNQLVLEQKLGLVAPDSARFGVQYALKTKGVSKITDVLVEAQVKKVVDYREFAKSNESELDFLVEKSLKQEGCNLSKDDLKILIKKLLEIDVLSYQLDKNKIDSKIWQYR